MGLQSPPLPCLARRFLVCFAQFCLIVAHCDGLLQAGYWREYADHVMATGDEAAVKAVFSRCLLTCLSVDLWRAYLNFIKRVRVRVQAQSSNSLLSASGWLQVHAGMQQTWRAGTMLTLPLLSRPLSPCRPPSQLNEPRGAAGLPEIRQAFEFTLDRLGQDSGCGAIWQDYIAFLQVRRQALAGCGTDGCTAMRLCVLHLWRGCCSSCHSRLPQAEPGRDQLSSS